MVCDVEVHSLSKTRLDELRAYRQIKERQRRRLRPLREDAFHEELFVIFGPKLSTKKAITALEALLENIRKDGLLIGKVEPFGDYYVESIDGKVCP
jgi:chromatin segregation and condensation protein Rec8/ScpA/Scc1 (kleisin family)